MAEATNTAKALEIVEITDNDIHSLNDTKQCRRCGEVKELIAFKEKEGAPDGRSAWCQECSDRLSAHRKANPVQRSTATEDIKPKRRGRPRKGAAADVQQSQPQLQQQTTQVTSSPPNIIPVNEPRLEELVTILTDDERKEVTNSIFSLLVQSRKQAQ